MPLFPNVTTVASDLSTAQGNITTLQTLTGNGGALEVRVDACEEKRAFFYTFTGAGDQVTMDDTDPKTFTKKATAPANAIEADDDLEWEAEVYIDGATSTPGITVKLLMGAAELESKVVATAAADDYVVMRGRGRVLTAGASSSIRAFKGLGETKDGTLSAHTHAAAADVAGGPATTSAVDFTVTATSDAGDAGNLATLKSLKIWHYSAD